jgi:succinate dehydrogenase / fumarate reductase, membrane anchor subunit
MTDDRAGGARHWRNQRITSIALVPLGLWFLCALLGLPDLAYATVTRWLAEPVQAFFAALFVMVALWHSMQGWQVVLEDYVGGRLLAPALRISRGLHVVAAIAAVGSVILVALGRA